MPEISGRIPPASPGSFPAGGQKGRAKNCIFCAESIRSYFMWYAMWRKTGQEEIRFLQKHTNEERIPEMSKGYLTGDRLMITEGPLKDYQEKWFT